MDWFLIIFVLVVIAISLSYWWYRQKTTKGLPESEEESPPSAKP